MLALVGVTAMGTGLVLSNGEASSKRQLHATTELSAFYLGAEIAALADVVTTWTTRPLVLEALASAEAGRLPTDRQASAFELSESLRLARTGVQYAFFTDANGISIANAPRDEAALGASLADRDWFQGAVASRRPYVSEIYQARATAGQPWVFAVAAPAYASADEGGALLGVVAATMPVATLQTFLDRTQAEAKVLQLVDHHNQLVGRTGDAAAAGSAAHGPRVREVLSGGHGVTREQVDGVDSVVAWRQLPRVDWGLTATQPAATAMADARRSALALVALATLLVVGVATATVLHRLARERRRLTQAESERALRASEQRFRTAFQSSLVGTLLLDEDGRVRQVNPAAETFFGQSERQLAGVPVLDLASIESRAALAGALRAALVGERPQLEAPFPLAGGRRRWGRVGIAPTPGAGGPVLVQIEDVTERREAETLLTAQALHDPLTRLPNRRLLLDRIDHCLAGRDRRSPDAPVPALLFIDLDGFKSINDRYGHEAGDEVLCEVADRLRASVRPTDTVARLGGDEFVVLDEAVGDMDAMQSLASRLIEVLAADWLPGREITASIGLAIAQPGAGAESLLSDADEAMYRAKSLGRNRFEAYDERLRAFAERRVRVEHELREAVGAGRLVVEYQPVVDLGTLSVVGLEALVRLPQPGGALAAPADFIGVAEDTGLVVPLGAWVLEHVCAAMASWHDTSGRWMPVSVNLSAQQAARPDLAETILAALAAHGVPGEALSLELTETVLLSATRSTLQQLERLREQDVQVGLDDFGTGFSSLSYLVQLPLDFLKVDRSFVAGLPEDRTSCAIVESTVALALRLGLTCVVEGIETPEQLAFVRTLGPVVGQGFLLAMPYEEEAVRRLVLGVPAPRHAPPSALVW